VSAVSDSSPASRTVVEPSRATAPASPADRAWCRDALARVSRTFAINIRLLSGSMGESVQTAYLMCRIADTLEDAWPGDGAEVGRRFDQLLAAFAGDRTAGEALAAASEVLRGRASDAHRELVARTPVVLRCFESLGTSDRDAVHTGVVTLASGMRRYAVRAAERRPTSEHPTEVAPYLEDEAELHDYCWVVAGCIGSMLTALFGLRDRDARRAERRVALAPSVGEGLQLTNILLDWPSDIRRGRCFVPASWLAERGLGVGDLITPLDGRVTPAVLGIVERLEGLALVALRSVPGYLDTIAPRHVRFRMFCLWPALWAIASLRHARHDPGFPSAPSRPRLPRSSLWAIAGRAMLLGHGQAGIEGLYRGLGVEPERSSTTSRTSPGSAV
jgi:farnesyl-diphosphate farnesyltransferase